MPQGTARSSPPPPPLLPGMPLPLQGVGVIVRHGHVDVELDLRAVLLGEKHDIKFSLLVGGGSLCSTLSPALQHDVIALEGEQKLDLLL